MKPNSVPFFVSRPNPLHSPAVELPAVSIRPSLVSIAECVEPVDISMMYSPVSNDGISMGVGVLLVEVEDDVVVVVAVALAVALVALLVFVEVVELLVLVTLIFNSERSPAPKSHVFLIFTSGR